MSHPTPVMQTVDDARINKYRSTGQLVPLDVGCTEEHDMMMIVDCDGFCGGCSGDGD